MTKQDIVREGIAKRHCDGCLRDEQCSFKRVGNKCPEYYGSADEELQYLHSQDVVIRVDRELPEKLTNNVGCMSKVEIEEFSELTLRELGYSGWSMKWTTAGNIMIEPFIYIDERNINQYPYLAKYWVLHEIAHIDTHPQDNTHGELFHRRLAELINRFLAGYVVVELLI